MLSLAENEQFESSRACSLQWRWRGESSARAGEAAKGGVVWSKEGTGQPVPRTEGPGPAPVACEGWKRRGCI